MDKTRSLMRPLILALLCVPMLPAIALANEKRSAPRTDRDSSLRLRFHSTDYYRYRPYAGRYYDYQFPRRHEYIPRIHTPPPHLRFIPPRYYDMPQYYAQPRYEHFYHRYYTSPLYDRGTLHDDARIYRTPEYQYRGDTTGRDFVSPHYYRD
jgi:hypothetical protein